LPISI